MTVEEELLARWLHDETPQPRRVLTVADLHPAAAPIRRAAPARRWAPLLAAAAAIVLVATIALVVAGRAKHRTTPPAHTRPPTPSPSVKAIGPWGARPLRAHTENMLLLAAANGSVYVENAGPTQRLDGTTGRVLASAPDGALDPNSIAIAGNKIWTLAGGPQGERRFEVTGYDLNTLRPLTSVPLTFSHAGAGADGLLTAAADGSRLAVAFENDIAVIDAAAGTVLHRFSIAEAVGAIALSPDGTRLYLGEQTLTGPQGAPVDHGGVLRTVDPLTGTDSAVPITSPHVFLGRAGLTATPGGVWVQTGGALPGAANRLYWVPSGTSELGRPVAQGREQNSVLTYEGGVVWVGTPQRVFCADPVSGRVRASATETARGVGILYSMHVTHGELFGMYRSPAPAGDHLIVRLEAPHGCTP